MSTAVQPRSNFGTSVVDSFAPASGGYWGMAGGSRSFDEEKPGDSGGGFWGFQDKAPAADAPKPGNGGGFWGLGATASAAKPGTGGGFWGLMYERGGPVSGAIDEESGEVNPLMGGMGTQLQFDINSALGVVKDVLSYGRKLHGLGGDEQQNAGAIPTTPHRETPVPQPYPRPGSMPYGPNETPFGKRVSENDGGSSDKGGAIEMAGVMPSVPFSETPKPQPMPGPLPPTSNPFGKRAEAEPDGDEEPGAIDTEETS